MPAPGRTETVAANLSERLLSEKGKVQIRLSEKLPLSGWFVPRNNRSSVTIAAVGIGCF
jgi:hypothetical protein